jgi:hypothetical protein
MRNIVGALAAQKQLRTMFFVHIDREWHGECDTCVQPLRMSSGEMVNDGQI